MILALADTSLIVDYIRGIDPGRLALTRLLTRRIVSTTVIVEAELWAGVDSPQAEEAVKKVLARFSAVHRYERSDARAAGALRRDLLRRRGDPSPREIDLLIAGAAVARGLAVLTANVRHFADLPGVRVLRP